MAMYLCFAFYGSIIISTVNAQGTFCTECCSKKQCGSTVECMVDSPDTSFVQSFTAGSTPPFLLTYDHDYANGANIKTCRYSVTADGPCNVISGDCTRCTYTSATNTLNVSFILENLTDSMDQSTIRYTLPASGISDVELVKIAVLPSCNISTINNTRADSKSTCGCGCTRNLTCEKGYVGNMPELTCSPDGTWSGNPTCEERPCNIADICEGCCNSTGAINFGDTLSVGCCLGSRSSFPSIQGECAVNGIVDAEKMKICCKGSGLSNGEMAGIVVAVFGVVIIVIIIVFLFCKLEGKWSNKWKIATKVIFGLGIIFWLIGSVLCFATGDDCIYPEMTGGQIAGSIIGSVGIICLIIMMGCFICFRA